MKKKQLFHLIILAGLIFFTVLSIFIVRILRVKSHASTSMVKLPTFCMDQYTGGTFCSSEIKYQKVLINYFHPDCEHCQYMAASFVALHRQMNDISIIMITTAGNDQIEFFVNKYHLKDIAHLNVLIDNNYQFQKLFGSSVVPSIFLYHDRNLIYNICGEIKISYLINRLND
jgi:thiol-disulfide isomerase/thioredoxin